MNEDFEVVTPEWIREQLDHYGLRHVDLANAIGHSRANMSALVGGRRAFSKAVKAAIFYYFEYLRTHRELIKFKFK